MTDFGTYVVFKPVPGGYVYAGPNAWLFGPRTHYLVNDAQRAEIRDIITSSSPAILWTTIISWMAISLLLGAGSLIWSFRSGVQSPVLTFMILLIVLIFSNYPALLISRHLLLRRLDPVLATLPPTNERITFVEEREAIAKAATRVTLSPVRRTVVRVACAVGLLAMLGSFVAQAIDMPDTSQALWLRLLVANANLKGLISILGISAFGASLWFMGGRLEAEAEDCQAGYPIVAGKYGSRTKRYAIHETDRPKSRFDAGIV